MVETFGNRGLLVLRSQDLEGDLAFFQDELNWRLEAIFPADAPQRAVLAGHGLRVRLEAQTTGAPGILELEVSETREACTSPGGTQVRFVVSAGTIDPGPLQPELVLTRAAEAFGIGRAGMQYRDLLPGRWGGRYIASHIRIPDGGPVPDYVHWHRVRFQMIHCVAGWVRVVYEDQGPPFVMEAGDGVLQPPGIRHRVLEASPGLEVVELGCPAEHETQVDHELELPTSSSAPERLFGGQGFVHYRASAGVWEPWEVPGFEARDTGIARATADLAQVRVVRASKRTDRAPWQPEGELLFLFVQRGELGLDLGGRSETLGVADALTLPPGSAPFLEAGAEGVEFLEVRVRGFDRRP